MPPICLGGLNVLLIPAAAATVAFNFCRFLVCCSSLMCRMVRSGKPDEIDVNGSVQQLLPMHSPQLSEFAPLCWKPCCTWCCLRCWAACVAGVCWVAFSCCWFANEVARATSHSTQLCSSTQQSLPCNPGAIQSTCEPCAHLYLSCLERSRGFSPAKQCAKGDGSSPSQ